MKKRRKFPTYVIETKKERFSNIKYFFEFLTMYGWPILILLIVIFALWQLDVFNPKEKFNPETDVCELFEPTIDSSRCILYIDNSDLENYNNCIEERAKCIKFRTKTDFELKRDKCIKDLKFVNETYNIGWSQEYIVYKC